MMFVSGYGSTRAALAIKAGAVPKRMHGVTTVRIEPVRAMANGQSCGLPFATEYVSSAGASIHVWVGDGVDHAKLEQVVQTLLYWKDVIVLTWSQGEPLGYHTYYKLDFREDRRESANERAMEQASGF